MIWEIVFWVSLFLLAHTYVFFPLIMWFRGRNKPLNDLIFKNKPEELPTISILLSVYNEEEVIRKKIESTFNTSYPADKIEFLIGSDASTDRTNQIIEQYRKVYPQIKLFPFSERTGKAGIINFLAQKANHEILVLTDAKVFFTQGTLYHLVKHFKNAGISVVGGCLVNKNWEKDGISYQEKRYFQQENLIKHYEGVLWGTMIGAFGACYAIRAKDYSPIPSNFYGDDFFITMQALEKGQKSVNELEAICYEEVTNASSEEFRRKVRISIGNFQNLLRFKNLLWPSNPGLAFSFFSHKVLRWMGPFLILLALISNALILGDGALYMLTFILQLIGVTAPIWDRILKLGGFHNKIIRFISHFYLMNLALLTGFLRFIKGTDSSIWEPTQRTF